MSASASSSSKSVRSEDELGEKWDRCIADSILKTGTGLGLGLVFSLLLFKRRPWPIALGTGFGLGYAVSNCQHDFKRVPTVHFRPVQVKASGTDSKSAPDSQRSETAPAQSTTTPDASATAAVGETPSSSTASQTPTDSSSTKS